MARFNVSYAAAPEYFSRNEFFFYVVRSSISSSYFGVSYVFSFISIF